MNIYEEKTYEEWSRVLRHKYGNIFRVYRDEKETLERWADHLSLIYGRRFQIRDDEETTFK